MYSQSFSPKALYTCTTQAERRNSGLKKEDFIEAVQKFVSINGEDEVALRSLSDD